MKKNIYLFLFIFAFLITIFDINKVYADESSYSETIVAENVKYYKTISYYSNVEVANLIMNERYNSYTIEISEDEYNNAELINLTSDDTIETTYKKMTASISKNGDFYQYMAVLDWKKAPSTRSYDVISLSHYSSVSIYNSPNFLVYYCLSSGSCKTKYVTNFQYFSNGVGASFKLPTGSLSTLQVKLYFNVQKNTDASIVSQKAVADYAHATSNVSLNDSLNYSLNLLGINFLDNVGNKYDSINGAVASWSGNW